MTAKRPTLSIKPAAPKAAQAAAPRLRASYEVKPVLQPGYLPRLKPDSLALCLLGAANAVAQVRAGAALPQALTTAFGVTQASPQARGAIQDIAYRTMRQLGRSEVLLGLMTSKAPEPPMLASLLCCALALIDTPDGATPPYEEFTVVDQAVTVATSHPDMAHAKGMVNAVLRRFLRERDAAGQDRAAGSGGEVELPAMVDRHRQGGLSARLAGDPRGRQRAAAVDLARQRAQDQRSKRILQTLADAGIGARRIGPSAVRLDKAIGVTLIPGFEQGLCSVQDAGAQLAAPLLDVHDGMRVLDACAAPGGKTGHILELADVDADRGRLRPEAPGADRGKPAAPRPVGDAEGVRGADLGVVGRPAVRPHPGRRAVHRVGHRAAPPGHPLAAAQGRRAPTCNTFGQNSRQPLADAAAQW